MALPGIYLVLAGCFIIYRLHRIFYNIYFHPLATVPGPKSYAASWIPRLWNQHVRGRHWKDLVDLHEKYGVIVRTGPDEVSNASPISWDAIGGKPFMRDLKFFRVSQLQTEGKSFISQEKSGHHFIRRLLLPAFSDNAFQRHENIVMEWTKKLCHNIENRNGEAFDLERILTWFTFDVMSVLSFGESFGCLENNRDHAYLKAVVLGTPFLSVLQVILHFRATRSSYNLVERLPWARFWNSLRVVSDGKAGRWLEDVADENSDHIMSTIYRSMKDEKTPISRVQAYDITSVLVLSGAEATPILMQAMIWNILRLPYIYEKVKEEIRYSGLIRSSADINTANLTRLTYLDAVLMESLRKDTPFATTITRTVPEGGAMVDGYWLPGGSTCGIPHWASGNWKRNFAEPERFVPERWIPECRTDPAFAKYANDKRSSFRPFAKGALDCLGKRFVYHETRMAIATLIWNFDMELQPESRGWGDGPLAQKVRIIRYKRPLMVKAWPRTS